MGTAKGDLKQGFYNHRMSFNNEGYSSDTTMFKYVCEIKEKFKINAITEMVHNQTRTTLFKHFQ